MPSIYSVTTATVTTHRANIKATLMHRLAVARAAHDTSLVERLEAELLQQDQQTSAGVPRPGFFARIGTGIKAVLGWSSKLFSLQTSLQVWQVAGEGRECWWCAYDPQTGRSVYADSEAELRQWIEQNYQGK